MGTTRCQTPDAPVALGARSRSPVDGQESKPLTLLERRGHRLKSRPSIDFELVKKDSVATPFETAGHQDINRLFDVHEALGQGTTGVVSRATRRTDGHVVALKVMRMDDEELLSTARQEFELLRSIQHPHIIEAFDFFLYPKGAVMVLSYFEGKTLSDSVLAAPKRCMPEDVARHLFRQLVLAVDHLHKKGIIHRDVKATNILVSEDLLDLKLVDFNTAQRTIDGALTMTGTVDYLPPEVLLGDSLCEKSDIWAAGLCLHLMLTGALPVERRLFSSRTSFVKAMCSQEVPQDLQHISVRCKTVLRACLEPTPQQRCAAADVLASEWLGPISPNRRQANNGYPGGNLGGQ